MTDSVTEVPQGRKRHEFGKQLVSRLEGTKVAYLANIGCFAYLICIQLAGFAYLYLRWDELDTHTLSGFLVSLVELHTGSSPFSTTSATAVSGIGNHVLIVMMLGVLGLGMIKVRCGKILQWSNFSSLRSGVLMATLFTLFAIGVHELLWYATYTISGFPHAYIILSSTMFGVGTAAVLINFFVRKFTKWDAMFVASITSMYLVWGLAGFHITVGFSGNTQWLNDFGTNLIENISWIILTTSAFLFYGTETRLKQK